MVSYISYRYLPRDRTRGLAFGRLGTARIETGRSVLESCYFEGILPSSLEYFKNPVQYASFVAGAHWALPHGGGLWWRTMVSVLKKH